MRRISRLGRPRGWFPARRPPRKNPPVSGAGASPEPTSSTPPGTAWPRTVAHCARRSRFPLSLATRGAAPRIAPLCGVQTRTPAANQARLRQPPRFASTDPRYQGLGKRRRPLAPRDVPGVGPDGSSPRGRAAGFSSETVPRADPKEPAPHCPAASSATNDGRGPPTWVCESASRRGQLRSPTPDPPSPERGYRLSPEEAEQLLVSSAQATRRAKAPRCRPACLPFGARGPHPLRQGRKLRWPGYVAMGRGARASQRPQSLSE